MLRASLCPPVRTLAWLWLEPGSNYKHRAYPSTPAGAEESNGGWKEEESPCGHWRSHRELRPSSVQVELVEKLGPPAILCSSMRARGRLKSFPAQTAHLNQPATALCLGICSTTGPRPRHHGRTSCPEQPATRPNRGQAGIC